MSKGTFVKQCQKCEVEMNGDMLDAQGVCLRCKSKEREEQQKSQKGKRDSEAYNEKEVMDNEPAYSDFITSDRSGRRNAIPDLQGDASLNLQKLAGNMSEIAISEGETEAEADSTDKEPGTKPKNQDDSPTV
ncbi:cAMP-dependent protein kinase inhibitor gamma [Paroedura picta]|uniref:cAMP-dependent protein kinase inhibitor gamma n=1 Tax=Paroedura picta TaxID=143630 RepID=UPI004055E505